MKCGKILEQLTAYADGELSLEEARIIRGHLGECPLCEQELCDQKKLDGWVRQNRVDPDPYFQKEVLKLIQSSRRFARENFGFGERPGRGLFRPAFQWAAAAAVFVVGLTVAYTAGYNAHTREASLAVGISQRDVENINEDIDFFKNYELVHKLDVIQNMDKTFEDDRL